MSSKVFDLKEVKLYNLSSIDSTVIGAVIPPRHSMRGYILTDNERRIAEAYPNEGLKLDGWTTLQWRMERFHPRLRRDWGLVERFREKAKEET